MVLTSSQNGTIFSAYDEQGDIKIGFALRIESGFLMFNLDLRTGSTTLRHNYNISDLNWHRIDVLWHRKVSKLDLKDISYNIFVNINIGLNAFENIVKIGTHRDIEIPTSEQQSQGLI